MPSPGSMKYATVKRQMETGSPETSSSELLKF